MAQKLYKMRILKGDTVVIRAGKYKGHSGKVLNVFPKTNKVTVEGVNVVKRHRKPTQAQPQGGIFELTKPIPAAKVGLFDSGSKKASRVSYRLGKDGKKIRVLTKSGKEIK